MEIGAGGGGVAVNLLAYPNVPKAIGAVISKGFATLHELDTVYGSEDLYSMLEIITVDAHNAALIAKARQ